MYVCVCIYIYIYVYTHTGILLSYKKSEILPFATSWVDLESTMLSEISQAKTNTMFSLIHGI